MMGDIEFVEDDATRTLELAEGYLEDAESVLWNASKDADSEDTAAVFEELTHDIWDLQHKIMDLQREFDEVD